MRRRLIAVLATGPLLLAGFTAAAVASGGSPLHLIASPATTAHGAGTRHAVKPTKPVAPTSPQPRDAEDTVGDTDADSAEAPEQESTIQSENKVVICHHTGSWKRPFHPISVDEHSVAAHTRHGDTLGDCPSAPTSEPQTTTHGPPLWAHGTKKGDRGRSSQHTTTSGPGNSGNERGHDQGTGGAHKNEGKKH